MRFMQAVAVVACWTCLGQVRADEIIPIPTAERHGLTRNWLTQIQMDRGQGKVSDVVLHKGVLYVQTTRAMIHAIDAETGQTLWAKQVGRPDHPNLTLSVSKDFLATLNGSQLLVVNRHNGEVVFETQVDGAPGAGPALSDRIAYVPTVSGLVLGYRLDPLTDPDKELNKSRPLPQTPREKTAVEEERRENLRLRQEYVPPITTRSSGRTMIQPTILGQTCAEEFCAWPSDRGVLNLSRVDRDDPKLVVQHEIRLDETVDQYSRQAAGRVAYGPGNPKIGTPGIVYVATNDGFILAFREKSGESLWKFATNEPIVESVVVVENRVFAATQAGGMFCLGGRTGKQLWWAPGIARFVSMSGQRVYGVDRVGQMQTLDLKSGARLDTLETELLPIKLVNSETDRIYLATNSGLVQCLRETDQTEAVVHAENKFKLLDLPGERPYAPFGKAAKEGDENDPTELNNPDRPLGNPGGPQGRGGGGHGGGAHKGQGHKPVQPKIQPKGQPKGGSGGGKKKK